ncbi:heme-degrading monooxygenase HmoA [Nocardiopsis arvandica]|uniref:Heme-degrading monooxygenase HmoA n=1 Tax=Nocardiopsis sinuspersici TaxID=501010 RepID=A0A7Y9XH23_9ACTN|nr:antibiotic biosynthesis monooxygenase family protein [Nocardiopsis sinuspersici]NYH55656.1 heme-degrading monooxygenase HmoA [Nocardiopsis sinuspersici]
MVTFVNRFEVSGPVEEFERAFEATSDFFRTQPGFVSHRMLRHLEHSGHYVNVAEWRDVDSFREAVGHPGFEPHARILRALATSTPGLYTPLLEWAAAEPGQLG